MISKPTILVLGATGKVGGKVVRLLAEKDDVQVVAGVRSRILKARNAARRDGIYGIQSSS